MRHHRHRPNFMATVPKSARASMGQGAQVYEAAAAGRPLTYFGYCGYEQSGMERSAAVTVNVFPGICPRSTQLTR